ncbi:TetR/AcrR family transcriptional regulator [Lentzea flaviverrucosa]|uniref:Transcriptional regulator, TetR family n=1 Tax=Lentzea flaviverrucosa TaxID=200379 RepID=A0A1H9A957_9PSEU|nr:TetR/AcrR family transcriptional regulator [Lentzea flaviverrucosa]RDI32128.1 TetR family transcriptional regulator [Lentzea flaviverrucosa]SEP73296.1 transcriptional regulator, TetR family [Lentzea flaviverrucosa]
MGSPAAASGRRQPIVEAAIEMTARDGWAAVTMTRLAEQVGVSRQTVYNEIGSKNSLADAMLAHELDRFLTAISAAFDRHADNLVEAVHDAVRDVLELARGNLLVRAIASATHGADTELVPLLTTQAETLLTDVKAMLAARVESYRTGLTGEQVEVLVDLMTRTVLSHVVQPTGTPAGTADGLAWLASRVLDEPARKPLRFG